MGGRCQRRDVRRGPPWAGCAPGDPVNLERPVRLADRLGATSCRATSMRSARWRIRHPSSAVRMAPELTRYVVEKGSITVDGVSLTVVEAMPDGFTVAVIPAHVRGHHAGGPRGRRSGEPRGGRDGEVRRIDLAASWVRPNRIMRARPGRADVRPSPPEEHEDGTRTAFQAGRARIDIRHRSRTPSRRSVGARSSWWSTTRTVRTRAT